MFQLSRNVCPSQRRHRSGGFSRCATRRITPSSIESEILPARPSDVAIETVNNMSVPSRFKRPDALTRLGVSGIFVSSLTLSVTSILPINDVLRLAILSYWIWGYGEFAVHKWAMHAPMGSWADRHLHINSLHVTHHKDTLRDMTMDEGYSLDALYFHLPNTFLQGITGTLLISLISQIFSLDIPISSIVTASFISAILHSFLWNSLHLDMHEVKADLRDGMPALKIDPSIASSFRQWVITNHTIHHECGGGKNYNVVLPGPDIIQGTYLEYRK